MKSLVMTTALSLAVGLVWSLGSAQSATSGRAYTVGVTAKTTPQRDRSRPYIFTTRGRITAPSTRCRAGSKPTRARNCIPVECAPGVRDTRYCVRPGRATICSGVVNVQLRKRGARRVSRNVRVKSNCTYRSSARVTGRGRRSVRVTFRGNRVLRPKAAPRRTVRAG